MPVDVYATTGVDLIESDTARELARTARQTARDLEEGVARLRRIVPGQVRLWRWRTSRFVRDGVEWKSNVNPSKILRRVVPLASVLILSGACTLVSNDGDDPRDGRTGIAPMPELSKKARNNQRREDAPWVYIMPVDNGLRSDRSGRGDFRAPRFHGEHNGIDLLAPMDTPLMAACKGKAMAGVSKTFGNWVHVICPVPDEYMKAGGPRPWASFFYAHMNRLDLPKFEWIEISRGQHVGAVGKSGNAATGQVQSHVHLELIIQKNRRHAMDERHLGNDQSGTTAADYFAKALRKECLDPNGFAPKSQKLQRARRLDPFLVLTCLAEQKPDFEKPAKPLNSWSVAWDRYYDARKFNVNQGLEDLKYAKR